MRWIPGTRRQKTPRKFRIAVRSIYSSTWWAGCAKVRPKPCTTGDRARAGHSAKITLSEAIIYVYVDWAQTGVGACFYGSGCSGLWGQLPGILPEIHPAVARGRTRDAYPSNGYQQQYQANDGG